jgi:hypothetical protein
MEEKRFLKTRLPERAVHNGRSWIVQLVWNIRVYGWIEPSCKMPNPANRHFTGYKVDNS